MLRLRMTMIVAFAAMAGSGCIVTTDDDYADYEPCTFNSDCDSFRCEEITADWPDGTRTTDGICTRSCRDELDCDITASGLDGTCADIGGGFVCYESCDFDSDCPGGFRCGELDRTGFFVCLPY